MISWLINLWQNHAFEVFLVGCVVAILILALFRIGKKGTWSDTYYYDPLFGKKRRTPTRWDGGGAPREKKYSKGEAECRRVLEGYFGIPFKSCRPDFLRNPVTGNQCNLEIDCYNAQMRLGVEYNGQQHYKYIPFFHRNKEAFYNQKYRDDMKRRICRENGITLVEVPYTVKHGDIERWLLRALKQRGIRRKA